jgi:uncharacterized membrane protein
VKLKLYFITLLIFLSIDAFWLVFVTPKFYQSRIGHLMAETPNLLAAGVFYLLFIGALVYFVVEPAWRLGAIRVAFGRGALFGLVTYATYDLTNLATLQDWPLSVTVVDMAWGIILTATTAAVSIWLAQKLK